VGGGGSEGAVGLGRGGGGVVDRITIEGAPAAFAFRQHLPMDWGRDRL
jgi:hypothetical protein